MIAHDGTVAETVERRRSVWALHFETARQLKANNDFVRGRAVLDDNGKMTGSMMVVRFETEDDLLLWLGREACLVKNVWQNIEAKPFKAADV